MKYTFILFFMAVVANVNAQTWVADSVDMGAGYTHDVYYDLGSGNDVRKVADDWDIAFQMTKFGEPMFNASVRANHIKHDVQVYLLNKTASTSFGNLTAADTMVTLSNQLVNEDTSWGRGAFTVHRGSNPFDYGWGTYSLSSHNLEGDTLYLVKANGVFYQLWIQEYKSTGSVGYKFRVAKWDGTNDVTDSIKRTAPYDDRLFAYYNFATGSFVDREPARKDWDLLFRQYQKNGQPGGQNPNKLQAYTGVLINLRTEVARIANVDPTTINAGNYSTHTSSMSIETNTIGDDWRQYTGPPSHTYKIVDSLSYIIKPDTAYSTEAYYHVRFTRFDGTGTGKVVFEKRVLYALSINDANGVQQASYSVYPNPAQNQVNIMVDAKSANANTKLIVTDITGKVLQHSNINLNKGVNAYSVNVANYPAGTYIVSVANDNFRLTEKLTVQH